MIPPVGGLGGNHSHGLTGFSASVMPESVRAPFYGARTFTVRTFGKMPPGPILAGTIQPFSSEHGQFIGGLHSVFMEQYRWSTGANRASCLRGSSAFPAREHQSGDMPQQCGCGLWAYCTGKDSAPGPNDVVWAVVQGWGRMIIGPKGFRAQHARIVALAFPVIPEGRTFEQQIQRWRFNSTRYPEGVKHVSDREQITRALRTAYPSPAYFDSVEAMFTEYPLTDLSALLPPPPSEPPTITGDVA